jgi:hypothetical protein
MVDSALPNQRAVLAEEEHLVSLASVVPEDTGHESPKTASSAAGYTTSPPSGTRTTGAGTGTGASNKALAARTRTDQSGLPSTLTAPNATRSVSNALRSPASDGSDSASSLNPSTS